MKRLFILAALALCISCASMSALQRAQQSHDFLALAQDTEANLCWNVSGVVAAIAAAVPPNHCTAPLAATIGLTDARHQAFNAKMKQALDAHKAATTLLATGAKTDLTALQAAITDLLALVAQLAPANPGVASLTLHLQHAGVK